MLLIWLVVPLDKHAFLIACILYEEGIKRGRVAFDIWI